MIENEKQTKQNVMKTMSQSCTINETVCILMLMNQDVLC